MRPVNALVLCIHCLAKSVLARTIIQLSVSREPPSHASAAINPSFAGFGIEPSNLFSFTGTDVPNLLTFNLIQNLVSYTDKAPHIRIGGNTQDYQVFNEHQTQWTWVKNHNAVGQGVFPSDHMVIGPRYFEAANRFPAGTPVTWGLNLAYAQDDWPEQITTMASQVFENCPNLDLVSIEVGNEPDLYLKNGFRSGEWNGKIYTEQWLERVGVLYEQVLRPRNITSAFFEPACTASTIGTTFRIVDLVGFGIDGLANNSNASFITSWNQHDYYYFVGVSTYRLTLAHFQRLSTVEDQFTAWAEQVGQAHDTLYPYALREMGLVGPVGLEGITDTFAAALWTLNFLLYAATLGVSGVQFHMTDNSAASAWQPVKIADREPFVRPLYYGYAAFDQVIGPTCTARVASIDVTDQLLGDYDGYVRVYAVYQDEKWHSLVVINSMPNNVSQASQSGLGVIVRLPRRLTGKMVHLAYLSGPGSDATTNTTWNNIEYESSGDGTPTPIDDGLSGKSFQVGVDGTINIDVRDSQAVVVNLRWRVGEGLRADDKACAVFSRGSLLTDGNGSIAGNDTVNGEENIASGRWRGIRHEEGVRFMMAWIILLGIFMFRRM
ncbi:hypothetical protein PFICI_11605 [Pestalotiopsis fici W106-1]|uniref:Beta-glucuronidase C-terminal domain-containing protein n=1 Tax=Pestalotiopsis fici (strain W106-1 / CGMCC3.15140) TaxID=1229662 RepID=W3WQV1_PESFW|nr:uncharacterized protein PFICI_11605 [Pestalotiopsis fici W106-1]ETS76218.1 hypothetical protein PFICI_11605 [Pestalotiopsis fici W106-1]